MNCHVMLRWVARLLVCTLIVISSGLTGEAGAKSPLQYNHPDLDWYTIETEHFKIHYPVSRRAKAEGNPHALTAEWSARKIAKLAEEVWPKVCGQFNYFLNEKVHVVVRNQDDQLEGFTVPSWDWIEISAHPGSLLSRSRGRMDWLSNVFVHEFAHVVSIKANSAMAEGARGVRLKGLYQNGSNVDSTGQRSLSMGAEVVLGDSDSAFWSEGGAEYWSDNVGYNWWSTSRDQTIRMSVLEGRLLTYDEWHARFGKRGWGDSELYYQQGYNFGLYLRQRFGDDTFARFAIEHGRRWRFEWVNVVEDVLGLTARELYADWVEYITDRYQAQAAAIKSEGEVVGRELTSESLSLDTSTPEQRDDVQAMPSWLREKRKEETGTYKFEPRTSSDGRWWGFLDSGRVHVHAGTDKGFQSFEGGAPSDTGSVDRMTLNQAVFGADFEHGWDFVPGKDAVVLTGREDQHRQGHLSRFGWRPELDGYNWKTLWYFEIPVREKRVGNRTVETISAERPMEWLKPQKARRIHESGTFFKIPNTERGIDPAVSPDGQSVAYFEYTDGTLNLVTIDMDGSNKRYLTNFDDGTWLQMVDWSPDGQSLVLGIFKNHQQNLYVIDKDGGNVRPIMVDAWEERDAHWSGVDGKIYFSADPTNVFNIFSYDPTTKEFLQLTNVVGGAQSPQVTREGHLIYNYFTAHGWKVMGLAGEEFLNKPANHLFKTDYDLGQVQDGLSFEEDLSPFSDRTRRYKAHKSLMSPTGLPMFELQHSGRSDLGLSGGGELYLQDYVQKHAASAMVMLGQDSFASGRYFYQGWYPTFTLGASHYRGKNIRGYRLDGDASRETGQGPSVFETKSAQRQNQMYGGTLLQWNDNLMFGLKGRWMNYSVKGTTDREWEPYMHAYTASAFFNFANAKDTEGPNPNGGRSIEGAVEHGWTNITYPAFGGVSIDDGEILDAYQYNRFKLHWTEWIRVPDFGIPFLQNPKGVGSHTLQFDIQLGMVDRNVDVNDEFRAGGQHPSYTRYSATQSNTQFAGYPGWSLSGETMAIFNVAYRFPLNRYTYSRWGPITTQGVWMQLGGTAGNLWSYRPPSDPSRAYRSQYDDAIAYDPSDVRREVPFKDAAYKNGNRMLYDAFAEVRVASVFRDGMYWNSFLRFAYGFNDIRGHGDVDGDNIFDSSLTGVGDQLSAEQEASGWRLYLGLGTGW